MPISVLIVDDHTIFRESVRSMLETTTDFHIVGEAANGLEALVQTERYHPNVVILDYMMPDMNGMDVTWWLCKRRQDTRVIILSMDDDESYVLNALQNGASGYVLKEDIVTHLEQAIITAAAGQFYFSPCLNLPSSNCWPSRNA